MRILFVCMGNICRSPTAEGVFRRVLAQRAPELQVELDSAGTHDYHLGSPPDRRAIDAARRRSIDIKNLRARQIEPNDFQVFDWILAMDRGNLAALQRIMPAQSRAQVCLVMDFAPLAHRREVPDPYYGSPSGFDEVLDLLEEAAEGLLQELLRGAGDRRAARS